MTTAEQARRVAQEAALAHFRTCDRFVVGLWCRECDENEAAARAAWYARAERAISTAGGW